MNYLDIVFLLIWSIAESIIWPVPIAFILISMVLLEPELWFIYGITVTLGSVIGAIIAYWLGKNLKNIILNSKELEWFRSIIGLSYDKINTVQKLYDKYGALAIIIAAVSPVPYKLVTWVSGVMEYNFKSFVILSLLGRGVTFISMAWGVSLVGEAIYNYINHYKSLGGYLVIILIVIYLFYKFFISKK